MVWAQHISRRHICMYYVMIQSSYNTVFVCGSYDEYWLCGPLTVTCNFFRLGIFWRRFLWVGSVILNIFVWKKKNSYRFYLCLFLNYSDKTSILEFWGMLIFFKDSAHGCFVVVCFRVRLYCFAIFLRYLLKKNITRDQKNILVGGGGIENKCTI